MNNKPVWWHVMVLYLLKLWTLSFACSMGVWHQHAVYACCQSLPAGLFNVKCDSVGFRMHPELNLCMVPCIAPAYLLYTLTRTQTQ